MNQSTSEIISLVFEEYRKHILCLSSRPNEMEKIIQEMYIRLQEALSAQYYNNVFRFVSSVDIDDMLSSSPPKTSMIEEANPQNLKTPDPKRKI